MTFRIPSRVNYSAPGWERLGAAYVWNGKQRSDLWKSFRGGRLGSSSVGAALGHSQFDTSAQVFLRMIGKLENKAKNEAIMNGIEHEDEVRAEYERVSGNKVHKVVIALRASPFTPLNDDGSDVPCDNPPFPEHMIAVSPDGLVGDDGMIEIKYATKPYAPLVEGCEKCDLVNAHKRRDFESLRKCIWESHYDQMQIALVTFGRKWCDYVVKEATTGTLRIVRVPLDVQYWNTVMFPGITRFFDAYFKTLHELGCKIPE